MGCGASKGASKKESAKDIVFKPIGIQSMDDFFDKAKEVLDQLASITKPLEDEKDKFFESNGFYDVPGACKHCLKFFTNISIDDILVTKHGFVGMFLALGSMVKVSIFS